MQSSEVWLEQCSQEAITEYPSSMPLAILSYALCISLLVMVAILILQENSAAGVLKN